MSKMAVSLGRRGNARKVFITLSGKRTPAGQRPSLSSKRTSHGLPKHSDGSEAGSANHAVPAATPDIRPDSCPWLARDGFSTGIRGWQDKRKAGA